MTRADGGSKARRPDLATRRALSGAARFYAVQALFQMEASGQTIEAVSAEFEAHRIGAENPEETWADADRRLFRNLVELAVDRQAEVDQMTNRGLVAKWPIARIDPTLRALFRAAGAELLTERTPPRVVINEFVEIARAFFPEGREAKFVNAVLDHMAREARPQDFA
ncbi:transcription antitermination factor NusB [Rhodobacteraceae bacterium 2376]|uniref:Transcription antitermination protein NusB n=1 Tax=Rhabdonatronobacter sediminivivens TaxID=2743469 RepID=A0A7Z0HW43_9RHOB|nr:transcription antitermination factor NusB [Rhabdonatronobacter sediminivivens]NYS23397.1 transcription antitermination factor NusB [Rhabdonatronobacter sediminivivens]